MGGLLVIAFLTCFDFVSEKKNLFVHLVSDDHQIPPSNFAINDTSSEVEMNQSVSLSFVLSLVQHLQSLIHKPFGIIQGKFDLLFSKSTTTISLKKSFKYPYISNENIFDKYIYDLS